MPSFIALFESLGYVLCENGQAETGFEKVALFADAKGRPTHAARLPVGKANWSSKLGPQEDIGHTIYGLEGREYGTAVHYLKRPA
jgi:hypothetical protein